MKSKRLFGLTILLLFFVVFNGCKTTEPLPPPPPVFSYTPPEIPYRPDDIVPLTTAILYRLGENNRLPQNVDRYQLVLSGRILMENEYVQLQDSVEGGKVRFEDIHTRNSITIEDRTEGQGLNLEIFGGEIIISVSFETEDRYRLNFSAASGNSSDEFFYLKFNPARGIASADQKGSIEYGGETYRLTYTGERPRLMIKLSQQDSLRLNSRTATGRRVN